MTRWKLTIEYHGGRYCGSQRQPDAPTVQGVIETAIENFCQQEIAVTFAGRTDAGVHARAQVAHLDLDYKTKKGQARDLTGFELSKAINAYMVEESVSVIDCVAVNTEFHARFGAKNKLYTYRIMNRPHGLAIDQGLAWWVKKKLDIEAMRKAAHYLIGEHDFSSFRDAECQAKSPIRSVDRFDIEAYEITGGQEILFHVEGQSFLHHQVRNMVGTLTHVGEGKWTPEDVKIALERKDRKIAGTNAPPDGLYLVKIDYSK